MKYAPDGEVELSSDPEPPSRGGWYWNPQYSWPEIANALTMPPCALLSMYVLSTALEHNPRVLLITIAALIHLPFSMAFHLTSAFRKPSSPEVLLTRNLDLVFIHLGGLLAAYALSGCIVFTAINAFVNLGLVARALLSQDQSKDAAARGFCVFLSVALYISPVMLTQNYLVYLRMLGELGLAGAFYLFRFAGRWSHACFHILLTLYQYSLLSAAHQPVFQHPPIPFIALGKV